MKGHGTCPDVSSLPGKQIFASVVEIPDQRWELWISLVCRFSQSLFSCQVPTASATVSCITAVYGSSLEFDLSVRSGDKACTRIGHHHIFSVLITEINIEWCYTREGDPLQARK